MPQTGADRAVSDVRERGIDGQSAFSPSRGEPSGIRVANEVEPVLVATGDRFARFDRPDVVVRKGRYALTNGHMTPRESMVEDLLALGAALDSADIPCLLVRDDAGRPILAVDRKRRKELAAALATAFADEPFYAEAVAPQQFAGHKKITATRGR